MEPLTDDDTRRQDYENAFRLVDEYMQRHPEANEDRAWDAVTLYNIDKQAAILASIEEHRP